MYVPVILIPPSNSAYSILTREISFSIPHTFAAVSTLAGAQADEASSGSSNLRALKALRLVRGYIHTYIHTYIVLHTYIRTYIHTYIRTYVHTYIHIRVHQ